MDLSTYTEDLIFETTAKEYYPIVSPDSTKIAFSSDSNSTRNQIWIMDIDGSNPTKISGSLDWARPADWVGNQILVNAYEPYGSGGSVWTLDVNTNSFQQVFYEGGQDASSNKGWINADSLVATKTARYSGAGGALLKLKSDGTGTPEVLWSSSTASEVSGSSISNDKSKILFQYKTGSTFDVYLYDNITTNGALLVSDASNPFWSPDDQHVIFIRNSNLWVADLTSNEQQITFDGVLRFVSSWVDPSTTVVSKLSYENEMPNIFSLFQNFPNPFNPKTKIRYSIKKTGNVQVFVYNLLGQKVADLVNENMEPGN